MSEVSLAEYVQEHGQTTTAERLGLTQGAIWQMLRSERDIVVREGDDGSLEAIERKRIGRAPSKLAS